MQLRCLCSVPDYYAAWVTVLKIYENKQANKPYTRGKSKHSLSTRIRKKTPLNIQRTLP